MKKNLLGALLFFIVAIPNYGVSFSGALDVLLCSSSVEERRAAYLEVLKDPDHYTDQIVKGIADWESTEKQGIWALNKLIYLAALLKKDDYYAPIKALSLDSEYTKYECIYDCAVNFALGVFGISKISKPLLWTDTDLREYYARSLKRTRSGIQFARPEDQELLNKMETLTEENLILQAAPFNNDELKRWMAVEVLSRTVSDDKNMIDLYWLAIEEIHDASCQYRCAVYEAIKRAEMAKALKDR
ncbi:MAG: hypothetical protein WCC00_13585 [Candidatus Aminicenantales bacterium]